MQIHRVMRQTFTFDETAERERIMKLTLRQGTSELQEWLLAILDAFIQGEWARAVSLLIKPPKVPGEHPAEFMDETIHDVLNDFYRTSLPNTYELEVAGQEPKQFGTLRSILKARAPLSCVEDADWPQLAARIAGKTI